MRLICCPALPCPVIICPRTAGAEGNNPKRVRKLQARLQQLGYLRASLPDDAEALDGVFGETTKAALMQ